MNLVTMSVKELSDAFCSESIIEELKDCTLIASLYDIGFYEGKAFVLFERNGTLYEVNGYHCSCFGLEDQWEPTVTTWKALDKRNFHALDGDPVSLDFIKELKTLIKSHLN